MEGARSRIRGGALEVDNQSLRKLTMDQDSDFGSNGCGTQKNRQCLKDNGAVDMESGLIARVAVTRASVPDARGLARICPRGGEACADKAYCGQDALGTFKALGGEDRAIKRITRSIPRLD